MLNTRRFTRAQPPCRSGTAANAVVPLELDSMSLELEKEGTSLLDDCGTELLDAGVLLLLLEEMPMAAMAER